MSSTCSSCCRECSLATASSQPSSSTDPYALSNLLQAGTVTLHVSNDVKDIVCNHSHVDDGWHGLDVQALIPHLLDSNDVAFCQELDFLMKQRFLAITYSSKEGNQIILRIYFIPYDLPNVQGKLRVRKDNILNPAKRYLRNLMPKISPSCDVWAGSLNLSGGEKSEEDAQDSRTLADIYSDLSSPCVSPVDGLGGIAHRLLNFEDDLEGFGMRSTLYRYQRRSVAAMLQRELDQRDVPDPLYSALKAVDGQEFYFQPGTMEILQQRPMTTQCRGGILCEELGTGKTVMTLSLIMATRSQISSPEPSIVDERPILTPLALRHFPSGEFTSARKRHPGYSQATHHGGVPSLVELLLHHHRTSPDCTIPENLSSTRYLRETEREDNIQTLPLGDVLRTNAPFYHHYLGEPNNRDRAKRKQAYVRPRTIFLTSATLVVVPPNLLSQWDREIAKHCAIPLRVLMLRAKTPMPSIRSLATDYDIILMTYTRFASEYNASTIPKLQLLHSQHDCKCPEIPNFRVPDCTCQTPGVSPFLQIRWKRLVIDEGHVSASTSTILVPFAKLLSVERRWIVTGTPTTNLLGLSLGNKLVEHTKTPLEKTASSFRDDELPSLATDDEDLMDESHPSTSTSPNGTPPPPALNEVHHTPKRVWNKYDREDLNKLGNMITHFIAVPQFSADSKLILTHVTEPLFDVTGPRRGSIQVLNQVMEMVMIRHRIEDVEKDVVLPPVTREEVLLDMDLYAVKSFNALQAIIVVNAVDSQRTDQDYMFHPRNAEYLQDTLRNMSQLFFWHVNDELYNAPTLLKDAEKTLQTALARNTPEDEIELLKEAFRHLQLAMDDPIWIAMQNHEDVPYRVFDMIQPVFNAWTRTPGIEPCSPADQSGFLHADRLQKLYQMVLQKPLIQENAMIEWGHAVAVRDEAFRRAYNYSTNKKMKSSSGSTKKKGKQDGHGHNENSTGSSGSLMVDSFAKKASATDTLREMQKELDATMARLATEGEDGDGEVGASGYNAAYSSPAVRNVTTSPQKLSTLAVSSPLARVKIGSSGSTKLNYIIHEVQKYAPTEKFLIFSESPLTLAHVAEALGLIHVKFLRFTTQVTPQYREQLVLTFETSETYRVFLMELKHGARGLNLISASRVIFCEPVWQADVESQAIKRAHRIGQTRPISVKTLAIRATAEENMVTRRAALRNNQVKLPRLIEEAGMRHYIANPKFITHPPTLTPPLHIPLINLPDTTPKSKPSRIILRIPAQSSFSPLKRVRVEEPEDLPSTGVVSCRRDQPPSTKKRSIRFATP
ncbi:SNF2 family N-terminal domain-containing protein [Crepidotus variabilis]|uniref:SNF2 family N-terminal domain-containing protein n=1 Tax=Crepidotus variabilis TaxID=179855 RepID=A0A9P6JTA8_9AGAR|nr:SNF2 family N-terminal domain-containing protein [Crepidotus variabilis]